MFLPISYENTEMFLANSYENTEMFSLAHKKRGDVGLLLIHHTVSSFVTSAGLSAHSYV